VGLRGRNCYCVDSATSTVHTYAASGSYVVQLTVTDPGGVSDTVSATVSP